MLLCAFRVIYRLPKGTEDKNMTTKASTKIKRTYRKEIEKATTINELVWIDTDYKQDMSLTCDDLFELIRMSKEKRAAFEKEGQRYTRATKPAWR